MSITILLGVTPPRTMASTLSQNITHTLLILNIHALPERVWLFESIIRQQFPLSRGHQHKLKRLKCLCHVSGIYIFGIFRSSWENLWYIFSGENFIYMDFFYCQSWLFWFLIAWQTFICLDTAWKIIHLYLWKHLWKTCLRCLRPPSHVHE